MTRRQTPRQYPRHVFEADLSHPAWRQDGPKPTPHSHPDAFELERIWPAAPSKPARKPARKRLSRRALRKRLSACGFRGERLSGMVQELVSKGRIPTMGKSVLGWSEDQLLERFGRRVRAKLVRGITPVWLIVDEFASYAVPGLAPLVQQSMSLSRKFSCSLLNVTQTLPAQPLARPFPTTEVGDYIRQLARSHGIECAPTQLDQWALAVTRLAGDDVQPNPVRDLLIALQRAGKLTKSDMGQLLVNYLRESKQQSGSPSPPATSSPSL